ncbi:MAG: hypothetical protein KKB90_10815 [Actinobacteria bacterium]|nr:hypothetical protein [Actinomycetota bacterium]MCG2817969.1 hypothetical protein [Actinomycetes bacterium]MBU4219437.1 hypothetical protein [Actinomycetota bacterium]MBU4358274.1 hypothetical protein [Actinomycetota bacterium]MBU4392299.1 hypothetical protein [Actinomycetota bacterium]
MERVFLYPQETYDPDGIAEAAREIISGSGVDPRGKTVLLKPSFVYPSHSRAPCRSGASTLSVRHRTYETGHHQVTGVPYDGTLGI